MTSIFDTSFTQNLNRVNSSAATPPDEISAPTEKGEHFAKVLGDLEHKDEKPNTPSKLQARPRPQIERSVFLTPPGPTITNITPEESKSLQDGSPSTSPPAKKEDISSSDPLLHTVKFAPEPVKLLAPETVSSPINAGTVPVGSAPRPPVIAAATRVTTTHPSVRPPAPHLAEIDRRTDVPSVRDAAKPRNAIKEIVQTAGKFYGIDPNLSMAVAQAESAFRPTAVSKDGHNSKGIFQLLDTTGRGMLSQTGLEKERYDPFDPAQNAYLGVGYLRRLHDIFSTQTDLGGNIKTYAASSADHLEKLAVAAFNAGEGNVARAQARARSVGKDPSDFYAVEPYLPASTRQYVQRVTQLRDNFAAENGDSDLA